MRRRSARSTGNTRSRALGAATLWLTLAARSASAFTVTTFSGGNLGPIPHGTTGCAAPGASLDVTFQVSGLGAPLTYARLNVTFDPPHTNTGDLEVVLFSPAGVASHVIFSRTGATAPGDPGDRGNLAGEYSFSDGVPGDWWATAAAVASDDSVPPGGYRTSSAGELPGGGAVTSMVASLTPLSAGQLTGTWTLRIRDYCAGESGAVAAASLTLGDTPRAAAPFDFDGDGVSDYVVVRNAPGGAETWLANVPPSTLVFRDGFESGDLTSWTAYAP